MPHGAMSALRRKIISISIVLKERIAGVHTKLTLRMAHQLIHGKGLKPEIIKHVKAAFDDLSDETLLNRCLHGKHTKCKCGD